MKVESLMSRPVWTCQPDDSLAVPARIMWEQDLGAVPVVAGDGGVVGVITDRDICMAGFTRDTPLSAMRVGDHMSKDVFTIPSGADVRQAEELMAEKQVHRLPVVGDGGKILGMISLNDVARAVTEPGRKGNDAVAVASTLSRLSRPRRAQSIQVRA